MGLGFDFKKDAAGKISPGRITHWQPTDRRPYRAGLGCSYCWCSGFTRADAQSGIDGEHIHFAVAAIARAGRFRDGIADGIRRFIQDHDVHPNFREGADNSFVESALAVLMAATTTEAAHIDK